MTGEGESERKVIKEWMNLRSSQYRVTKCLNLPCQTFFFFFFLERYHEKLRKSGGLGERECREKEEEKKKTEVIIESINVKITIARSLSSEHHIYRF